jgi:HSP20 family protein
MSINLYPVTGRRNSLLSDFDSIFNDIFRTNNSYKNNKYYYGYTGPKANVERTEEGFCLSLAAPGYSKDEFDINIENGVLTIGIENKEKKIQGEMLVKEYGYQTFTRSWTLPENTNVERINARYEAGILSLDIPVEGSRTIATKISVE